MWGENGYESVITSEESLTISKKEINQTVKLHTLYEQGHWYYTCSPRGDPQEIQKERPS